MSSRVRRRRIRPDDIGDERSDVVRVQGDRPRWARGAWPPLPPWGYYGPPPWVRAGLERLHELEDDDFLDRPGASEGVDVHETDEAWIVEADVPGVDREDISIELRGDVLRIMAAVGRDPERGGKRRRAGRRERFDYRVEFPEEVDADGITADLDSGVLTVSVPRRTTPSRRIEIRG